MRTQKKIIDAIARVCVRAKRDNGGSKTGLHLVKLATEYLEAEKYSEWERKNVMHHYLDESHPMFLLQNIIGARGSGKAMASLELLSKYGPPSKHRSGSSYIMTKLAKHLANKKVMPEKVLFGKEGTIIVGSFKPTFSEEPKGAFKEAEEAVAKEFCEIPKQKKMQKFKKKSKRTPKKIGKMKKGRRG